MEKKNSKGTKSYLEIILHQKKRKLSSKDSEERGMKKKNNKSLDSKTKLHVKTQAKPPRTKKVTRLRLYKSPVVSPSVKPENQQSVMYNKNLMKSQENLKPLIMGLTKGKNQPKTNNNSKEKYSCRYQRYMNNNASENFNRFQKNKGNSKSKVKKKNSRLWTVTKSNVSNFLINNSKEDLLVENKLELPNPIVKDYEIKYNTSQDNSIEKKEYDSFIDYLSPNDVNFNIMIKDSKESKIQKFHKPNYVPVITTDLIPQSLTPIEAGSPVREDHLSSTLNLETPESPEKFNVFLEEETLKKSEDSKEENYRNPEK